MDGDRVFRIGVPLDGAIRTDDRTDAADAPDDDDEARVDADRLAYAEGLRGYTDEAPIDIGAAFRAGQEAARVAASTIARVKP